MGLFGWSSGTGEEAQERKVAHDSDTLAVYDLSSLPPQVRIGRMETATFVAEAVFAILF